MLLPVLADEGLHLGQAALEDEIAVVGFPGGDLVIHGRQTASRRIRWGSSVWPRTQASFM